MSNPSKTGDVRRAHPYFTHDMIVDQPSSLKRTMSVCEKESSEVQRYFQRAKEFILTGCGTSFHAALGASYLLYSSKIAHADAVQSFELLNYYRQLKSDTLVLAFSHTGKTKTTIDALSRAMRDGASSIALCGTRDGKISEVASKTVIVGNGEEKSRAHTRSYTSSLFASMYFSLGFLGNSSMLDEAGEIPRKVESAISQTEKIASELVDKYGRSERYFLIGAGPNLATALEGALKMKETNYTSTEGMELEQFLHGPWVSTGKDSLVVLVAPKGPSRGRFVDLLKACRGLEVPTVALTNDPKIEDLAGESIRMEDLREELSPLTYIVPLQFFAYYLSLKRGLNPDFIHYDVDEVWDARTIIFPPGTH